jgi:predicted kinase
MTGRIVILSGPPGAGKSTVARAVAEQSEEPRAIHFHTDDFFGYIRKGYVDPWLREAAGQNAVNASAQAAFAGAYAAGGYEVFVDGVIGPWLLEPWLQFARSGTIAVHYVVLRPNESVTVARVTGRGVASGALRNGDIARDLWRQFSDLGAYESHVVDTTGEDLSETIARLRSLLASDRFRLP